MFMLVIMTIMFINFSCCIVASRCNFDKDDYLEYNDDINQEKRT